MFKTNHINSRENINEIKFILFDLLRWYSYHFAIHDGHFNQFLNAGKLTHQFVVDAFFKTAATRLQCVLINQSELIAEDNYVLYKFVNRQESRDINIIP